LQFTKRMLQYSCLSPECLWPAVLAQPLRTGRLESPQSRFHQETNFSPHQGSEGLEKALRYNEDITGVHQYIRGQITASHQIDQPYPELLALASDSAEDACLVASRKISDTADSNHDIQQRHFFNVR
jgi:hypothetical protein